MSSRSTLYPLFAACLWGGMYVVSKASFSALPPITLGALRLAIGVPPLWFLLHRERASGRLSKRLTYAVLGVFIAASLSTQFVGTDLASASSGAALTVTTPALVVGLGRIVLREHPPALAWFGLALSLGGASVIVAEDVSAVPSRHFLGELLLLVSGLSWALYSIYGARQARESSALAVTTYASAFSLVFLLPFVPFELNARPIGEPSPFLVGAVLYLGLGATALAWYLWTAGLEVGGTSRAAAYFLAQPVVGGTLGWLLLSEQLTVQFVIGAAIIGAGMILVSVRPVQSRAPPPVKEA